MFRSALALGITMALVALISGCGNATDPAVLAQRAKYMLDAEPAGALGVLDVRQKLSGEIGEFLNLDEGHSTDVKEIRIDQQHEKDDHHHTTATNKKITVVGRIGGVSNPWSEGSAGFWIVDNTTKASADQDHEGHDHAHSDPGHDPDTCPFCKQSNNNPKALAIVQFEDEQGKVLGIDARKLFDVSRNQTVVIQGSTNFDDLGNLVISASGLYIRE